MSAVRQAALRRLSSELASQRFWRRPPDPAFTPDLAEAHTLVDAFVAIGGLSAEEAATWRTRFERAVTPPEPDPALCARAQEHLAALRNRPGAGDDVDRLGAAVAAYSGAALLSQQEAAKWRGESERPRPRLSALRAVWGVDVGSQAGLDDAVSRGVRLGPELRVAGLRVTVIELYEGAVVIHWHYSATAGEDPAADALWQRIAVDDFDLELEDEIDDDDPVRLADDSGTAYVPWTSAWSVGDGSARTAKGHSGFGPGVPATASRLEIQVEGETIPVDLG